MAHHCRRNIATNGLVYQIDANNKLSYIGSGSSLKNLQDVTQIGTINNISFANGLFDLDGATSYIEHNSSVSNLTTNTKGSIVIWFNIDVLGVGQTLLSIGDTDANKVLSIVVRSNNSVRCYFKDTTTYWRFSSLNTIGTGSIKQLVITQDAIEPKMYLNGSLFTSSFDLFSDKTKWISSIPTVDNITIGAENHNSLGNQNFLDGKFVSATIYDRELTAEEIKQNYEALKFRFQ